MTNIIMAGYPNYIYFYGPMSLRFPRGERLKSKKRIQQLFEEGSFIVDFPIKLLYLDASGLEVATKMAVSVPKKNFKRAVDRNRIKRLLRESYRLHRQHIFNKTERPYALMFLYLGKEIPEYAKLEAHMIKILGLFLKKIKNEEVPK